MVMERDKHEGILNELLDPEIDHSRRTELLQELRVDYGSTLSHVDEIAKTNERLHADNSDLVISNSKLFRQVGLTTEKEVEVEKEKEFSETVSLEGLGI